MTENLSKLSWNIFEKTGNVESFLLYTELKHSSEMGSMPAHDGINFGSGYQGNQVK